ncbi:Signal peptidase I [Candidatus Clavichlamydia salmonicola]|uniref:signal peptidase I n=1 Tax=Candidatus Clavichlamydia salmonicola TaxID=469812 RepID=UPI001890E9A0|nr:signal peptidase I [Candidatus Clavichlamydia salmonicola]MBF5050847.1 Signal peptidase I [Candidatus Clavichlamydia salmonicola]
MTTFFSLKKHRQLLNSLKKKIEQKRYTFSLEDRSRLDELLQKWSAAITASNVKEANLYANKCLIFTKRLFHKSWTEKACELSRSLIFSLIAAFLVRQFWVEFYQVPTGSMRPSILEKDRIIVSKSTFGLKIPFKKQLIFPSFENLKRNRMVVFTAENTNIPNAETSYFYFFKGKKRYVKRCVGKPGDILYFYGGKIYGINKSGKEIVELHDDSFLTSLFSHPIYRIPFLSFEGNISQNEHNHLEFLFNQTGITLGRLLLNAKGHDTKGQFFSQGKWHSDRAEGSSYSFQEPTSFCQLWGMENYGTTRILTPEQAYLLHPKKFEKIKKASAYAEIRHHANLTYPYPSISRLYSFSDTPPLLSPMTTILPLFPKHLNIIKDGLTTSRFMIKKGSAFLPRNNYLINNPFCISLPRIPDGSYELENGIAYQVFIGGFRKRLSPIHPLNHLTEGEIILLFNCGHMFSPLQNPSNFGPLYTPPRFAFFNNGSLFLGDIPVFSKEDKSLSTFNHQELEESLASPSHIPYIPFADRGSPLLNNGSLNIDFIKKFGLHIPENYIFVLGDNHAMSSDSRDFGFIPTSSLIGSPILCFWPLQRARLLLPLADFSKGTASLIVRGLVCGFVLVIFLKSRKKD